MKRGGEKIKGTVLFGKYQIIRILGKGRSGTVYLARHLELEEYRAVKEVPKSRACYEQFKKEALLLKRLRHPGIPIVYDLQEEEDFSYLIEEFLEGDSFYDLMKRKGHLNQDAVIRYGIQICDLVHYLHSAEEIPILYLDLQPRNLLLCHEQVKLLDFDHAATWTEANHSRERYGTPGYCAPEQQKDEELGVYTDIYQIGAFLKYLLTGHAQENSAKRLTGELGKIIYKCLRSDKQERYQSVIEIQQELEDMYSKADVLQKHQSTSLIIAFAGSRPGAGTTHLAIGLCAYLNQNNYQCLYEEWNPSNDVRAMAEYLHKEADSYGICSVFGLTMKPYYGKAVRLLTCGYPVIVQDYGLDWKAAKESRSAMLFLVTGGKWWDQKAGAEAAFCLEKEFTDMVLIYNHTLPGVIKELPENLCCLRAPQFSDPFKPDEQTNSFYAMLVKDILHLEKKRKTKKLWESMRTIFSKRKGLLRETEEKLIWKKNLR